MAIGELARWIGRASRTKRLALCPRERTWCKLNFTAPDYGGIIGCQYPIIPHYDIFLTWINFPPRGTKTPNRDSSRVFDRRAFPELALDAGRPGEFALPLHRLFRIFIFAD